VADVRTSAIKPTMIKEQFILLQLCGQLKWPVRRNESSHPSLGGGGRKQRGFMFSYAISKLSERSIGHDLARTKVSLHAER